MKRLNRQEKIGETLRESVARECRMLYDGAECAYWECNEGGKRIANLFKKEENNGKKSQYGI